MNETHVQFERIGFFVVDKDSKPEEKKLVFNLTVGLKDTAKPKTEAAAGAGKSRKAEQEKALADKLVCGYVEICIYVYIYNVCLIVCYCCHYLLL